MSSKNPQEESDCSSQADRQEEGISVEQRETITLDEVLTNIGIGTFHFRMLMICGLGFSAIAVEVVLASFLISELRLHWKLDEYKIGVLTVAGSAASITGALLWGICADRFGRRVPFILSVLLVGIFGVLSALAQDYPSIVLLRGAVGLCLGGSVSIDFAMYTEFFPSQGRGHWMFLLQTFWPLGQLASCLAAWAVIPQYGWRNFLVVCAVPAFISAMFRPLVPESPRWLLLQDRHAEAKEVLRYVAITNGQDPDTMGLDAGTTMVIQRATTTATSSTPLRGTDCPPMGGAKGVFSLIAGLFSRPLLHTSLGMMIFSWALHTLSFANLTFMPSILTRKGIAWNDRYYFMVMTTLAQVPAVALMVFLSTRVGRLLPIKSFLLIGAFCFLVFASTDEPWVMIVCMCLCSFFLEGCWGSFHVYVPEAYPTELRTTAVGFLSSAGSVSSAGVPMVSAFLLTNFTLTAACTFFVMCAFVGSIAAILFLHVETFERQLDDSVCSVPPAKKKKFVM